MYWARPVRRGQVPGVSSGYRPGVFTPVDPALWVPRTRSPHATCKYSWNRPPRRSRRSGRTVALESSVACRNCVYGEWCGTMRRLAARARIVLLAAEGLPNAEIARRTGTSRPTVVDWRARYDAGGIRALDDLPRSGRPPEIDEIDVVVATLADDGSPAGASGGDALVGSAAGRRAEDLLRHGGPDLAQVEPAAVAGRDVQVLHRPRAGREDPRRRRAVSEPAGEGRGSLRRREVAGPGPGPDRADPADHARGAREADPRLRPQRHHHPVRRARGGHRPGRAGLPAAAPPPGVPAVPQTGRQGLPAASSCTWCATTTPPTSTPR